jgi:hypothetical protein
VESVYHIVTIRVNETSWAHVWMLHSRYLGTRYDKHTDQTGVASAGSQVGQTGVGNRSDRYCVASYSFFILLCVISCHMHHVYLYDTFTLVSTPQIERYRGSSMILIEYVRMMCLGHF